MKHFPGNMMMIRTSEKSSLGDCERNWFSVYDNIKMLNCVNIEYVCTEKHGLSIMLFGCHKEKQLHQKLAASDINNNNNTTTNDGNINDIYVT